MDRSFNPFYDSDFLISREGSDDRRMLVEMHQDELLQLRDEIDAVLKNFGVKKEDGLAVVLVTETPLSGGSPFTMLYRYMIGDFELRFTQDIRNGSVSNLALRAQSEKLDCFDIEVHEEEVAYRVYYPTEFRVRAIAFPRAPEDVHTHLQNWKYGLMLVGKLEEFFKTSKHYVLFCKHNAFVRASNTLDDMLCCARMCAENEDVSSCSVKQTDERVL